MRSIRCMGRCVPAPSDTARRSRQAAIEFGGDRLLAVQAQRLASDLPDIEKRTGIISPCFEPSDDENGDGTATLILIARKRP